MLQDIEYLDKKNREMGKAVEQNQPEKLGTLNKDFHLRIYRAAPYPYLSKLIGDLWEKVERTQSVFAYVPERAAASVAEHALIIEALRAKDSVSAEKLIKQQKSRTMAALQKYIHNNT
jgi:DNA-binding GntR family transcriptional regulator